MSLSSFVEDRLGRATRLAILAAVAAFVFPGGRFGVLAAVLLVLLGHAVGTWKKGGGRTAAAIVVGGTIGVALLVIANHDRRAVEDFLSVRRPIDLALVPDGVYEGDGPGNNGRIRVRLTVADARIARIEIAGHQEAVYAFDEVLPRLVGRTRLDTTDAAGFVLRNERLLAGLQAAMEDAVLPSIFEAPRIGKLARAVFSVTSNEMGKITANTLAVLFIALLAFEYMMGPALRPGIGQSLNCYNCQACVGVCPVKRVEGEPFPLTMVLAARLGDLARVRDLARLCVGCGRCAAKCPVGNSGPSIASGGYVVWRERERRGMRRSAAQGRGNGRGGLGRLVAEKAEPREPLHA